MPLAPTASAHARQTIRDAFEGLDKTISPAESRSFADTTLQDVRTAAIQLEQQLAARKCLQNMRRLEPLFKGLEHYAKTVDLLCNGTPYLPWIWAPITLILRVASEYVEAFEKIIKAYSRIAESLKRFEILDKACARNKDFQQTLAAFYADILEFHLHAYKFTTRNGWKLLFVTSWGRFERRFDGILESMKRHEGLIDKEANAYNIAESQKMREEIREWRRKDLEQTEQLEKDEARRRYESIASWLKANDSEQQLIYDSLHSEGQNYPGTCDWALKNKKIQLYFQRKPATQVLWLHGVPGSGKSVLLAELVNFAESADCYSIRFFCSRLHRSNRYDQILRALFLQLLRKDSELIANVYRDSNFEKPPPSNTVVEKLFHRVLTGISNSARQNEYVWVFVDGLNECDPKTQTQVMQLIKLMVSKITIASGLICKVLISSRDSESKLLRIKEKLSLTEEKPSLSRAIMQYTSQRLQALHVKLEQLNLTGSEVGKIEQSITKKSDGMFLYARLLLDYLANNIFIRGAQVISAVHDLPETLSDFYRQILSRILTHLNKQSVNYVTTLFGLIAFARRPLKRVELLSAMAFSEGDYSVTNIAPRFILETCNTLVEERSDTTLSFIHASVQEFLESSESNLRITELPAVEEQGIATLTCLLSGLRMFARPVYHTERNIQVAKGLHGLHIYATEYWVDYLLRFMELVESHNPSSKVIDLAGQLCQHLDGLTAPALNKTDTNTTPALDSRLELLKAYPTIQKQVRMTMQTANVNNEPLGRGLEAILSSYQTTVRFLLDQDDYPGVSPKELEEFKLNFRTSAYTCRLGFCPRSTLGFESRKDYLEHKAAHFPLWSCEVADCQYPSFRSAKALRDHTRERHDKVTSLRSIRRERRLPEPGGHNLLYQASEIQDTQDPRGFRFHQGLTAPGMPESQQHERGQIRRSPLTINTNVLSPSSPGSDFGEISVRNAQSPPSSQQRLESQGVLQQQETSQDSLLPQEVLRGQEKLQQQQQVLQNAKPGLVDLDQRLRELELLQRQAGRGFA
ncbi:hypothetical protein NUW58_g6935 [Xylaria curta]|uniref:Uncharacterized protein n=1 Tax=Xylaria curta TaxID=42375 RepID=A0ACC1NPX2_9PEZI|nr:hypothetical protein NUW58_g6935 [Xylaria curta]